MDNLPFFQEENKDLLYNLCKDEIYKEKQYNIDDNRKYYKTFGEIMKIVYKHSKNKNDITSLNKEVLSKTIPYLNKEIEAKKLKSGPLLPPQVRQHQQAQSQNMLVNQIPSQQTLPVSFRPQGTPLEGKKKGVNEKYEKMMNDRDLLLNNQKPVMQKDDFSLDYSQEQASQQKSTQDLYQQNLDARAEIDKQFDIVSVKNNLSQQTNPNQGIDSNNFTPSISSSNNLTNTNVISQPTSVRDNRNINSSNVQMTVQDFTVSSSMVEQLHQDPDINTNIMTDMNTYREENNEVDPRILLERMQQETQKQDSEFSKIQKSRINYEDAQKEANLNLQLGNEQHKLEQQIQESRFQESLTYQMENEMNQINVEDLKGQFDRKSETFDRDNIPKASEAKEVATNKIIAENDLFSELKEHLFKERKYVNKENLIIINSADRDWYNNSQDSRYQFNVKFQPETDSQDCGIQNIFRNIVTFELIRVLMPVENFIIPFDRRIFIDYKSLPYIVLNIEEIEGLYSGTNSNTNQAFAQLLWDKDHTSEVIVDAQQEGADGTVAAHSKSYSRQFKRGFSSMAPMSFEKKTFYPTPLSSLNRLTMSLETPYGESILNHPDVLDILSVSLVNLEYPGLLEISDSNGFPFKTSNDIIEIKTYTYFNNRVFKIGDMIQIKGFKFNQSITDTNLSEAFINRNKGHFIINLEKEVSNNSVSDNEGYIQKIYISPPSTYNQKATTTTDIISNESVLEAKKEIYANGAAFSNNGTTISSVTNPTTHLQIGDLILVGTNYRVVSGLDDTADTITVTEKFGADATNQKVDRINTNLFIDTTETTANQKKCKLINKSLQTHFTFKIVTREEDIHSHMLSANV